MNSDIIAGLVYEHMTIEPVVIQKLDEKNTLLVFTESEDIQKICNTLISIEMWLGHSVNIGCNVATPEQVSMGDQLHWVGREEIMSVEGANMQLHRQVPEPQCDISCPSVASEAVGKLPNFSIFSGDSTQKREVLFEQWAFEVKSVMQSHTEVTLREGIVWSLCRATADLVWYLGLQAPVSEIINKVEPIYGTVASFNILMQNFYNCNKGRQKRCQYM